MLMPNAEPAEADQPLMEKHKRMAPEGKAEMLPEKSALQGAGSCVRT